MYRTWSKKSMLLEWCQLCGLAEPFCWQGPNSSHRPLISIKEWICKCMNRFCYNLHQTGTTRTTIKPDLLHVTIRTFALGWQNDHDTYWLKGHSLDHFCFQRTRKSSVHHWQHPSIRNTITSAEDINIYCICLSCKTTTPLTCLTSGSQSFGEVYLSCVVLPEDVSLPSCLLKTCDMGWACTVTGAHTKATPRVTSKLVNVLFPNIVQKRICRFLWPSGFVSFYMCHGVAARENNADTTLNK